MKLISRIIIVLLLALLPLVVVVSPALAINNPTSMAWGTGAVYRYRVFTNVQTTGDFLFIAEPYVHYAVTPTDYTASQSFLFEVLDTTGTVILVSTPLQQYEDRPIAIYQTPTQAAAFAPPLASGTAYKFRVRGNPLIFATGTGNTLTATLTAGDYVDQSTSTDAFNPLAIWCMAVAKEMQTHDVPAYDYWTTAQGIDYLTTTGGNLFLEGVPSLNAIVPILFQTGSEMLSADAPTSTHIYSDTRTPANTMNTVMANALTNMGLYLHVPQWVAGVILIMALTIGLSIYANRKFQSNLIAPVIAISMLVLGTFFGLPPMTILFVTGLLVVGGLSVYFWGRLNV